MEPKSAVIIHSGGMDSSLCLALAIKEFGPAQVLSLSFDYGQRHAEELKQAEKICADWQVDHLRIQIQFLSALTSNALLSHDIPIQHPIKQPPNTLVLGRNGLMARLGAIAAHERGAHCIFMGVLELEVANSGYRDCSRHYMDLMEKVLQLDLGDSSFQIRTPLVKMTKKETLELAEELGVLEYLLTQTISCYEGLQGEGCRVCPACRLKNEGIEAFHRESLPKARR